MRPDEEGRSSKVKNCGAFRKKCAAKIGIRALLLPGASQRQNALQANDTVRERQKEIPMNTKPRIVTTVLIIIGLVCSAAVAKAQGDEDKIRELEARITRLEARLAVLEQAAAKWSASSAAPTVAAKRWTVPEIKAACAGKTTAEIKALLGPPDQIKNTLWGYEHLVISDPESGTELNFLVLEFVGGRARISQLRKG